MLYAEESPYEPWVGKRIWINLDAIGLGKVGWTGSRLVLCKRAFPTLTLGLQVWDFNVPLFNRKRKDDPELTGPDEVIHVSLSSLFHTNSFLGSSTFTIPYSNDHFCRTSPTMLI